MNNHTLAQSYMIKATKRLRVLEVLMEEEAYSDVVREAQETVELALKGMLRQIGVEPPKQHDVGGLILEYQDRLPSAARIKADRLARISKWLRKEREFAFYGDIDFIPTAEYTREDGERAVKDAVFVVEAARAVIPL